MAEQETQEQEQQPQHEKRFIIGDRLRRALLRQITTAPSGMVPVADILAMARDLNELAPWPPAPLAPPAPAPAAAPATVTQLEARKRRSRKAP